MTASPGVAGVDQHLWSAGTQPIVGLRPVLDVARRTAGGFEAVPLDGVPATLAVTAALDTRATLPPNTFLTVPVGAGDLADEAWLAAFLRPGDLGGVVVHLDHPERLGSQALHHLRAARDAGALLSTGGRDDGQPSLSTIADLRPAIVRLGRAWVCDLDVDSVKQRALASTGRLAAQLDAWVLADEVRTPGELATLAELEVPLAQGPVVGGPSWPWPAVSRAAHAALRDHASTRPSGPTLRELVQRGHVAHESAPPVTSEAERTGYDLIVVVDDRGRPVSLLTWCDDHWESSQPSTINIDTRPEQALERAHQRPGQQRPSPWVCTDAAGRFCGVLRQDRTGGCQPRRRTTSQRPSKTACSW